MLTVVDFELIRRKIKVDGWSIREVARKFGYSRKSIKKALKYSSPPGYIRVVPVKKPVIEPFAHIIDAWLDADGKAPPKQRHTGERIFERLRDEHEYKGSIGTVRRYIRSKQKKAGDVFFPLVFGPGEEAQVDWGEAWYILNGAETRVHLFCIRLCHGRVSFVRAYPTEKLEAFLDGHVQAFKYFGGVPRRLAYDNLKAAVIQVGRGRDRKLNKKFLELRSHYLFESRFCNVASGNEKGHVENLVKFAQRTFMTPPPSFTSLEQLNRHLEERCLEDLKREVEEFSKTREELLEDERKHFLPLPERDFEACIKGSTEASKSSFVTYETNAYSVPVRFAHHTIQYKVFVDSVELWHQDNMVAMHSRSYDRMQYILEPEHYIPLLERKPGGLLNGRPFKGEPWGADFTRMRNELEFRYDGNGTKMFTRILLLFSEYPVDQVKSAVRRCLEQNVFSDEAVKSVLNYRPVTRIGTLDLSERPELKTTCSGIRAASEYDKALLEKEVKA